MSIGWPPSNYGREVIPRVRELLAAPPVALAS
jgi:hypothetical protein